jgi:hypothetical protein
MSEKCIVAKIKEVYGDGMGTVDWHAGEAFSPDRWAEMMRLALPEGGYNLFSVDEAHAWLGSHSVTLEPAREGSVAVYVHGPRAVLERIRKEAEDHGVDEAHHEIDSLRLWWD